MASSPVTEELPGVLRDVTEERHRQIVKGYTPEHDDRHSVPQMWEFTRERVHLAMGARSEAGVRIHLVEAIAILVAAVEAMDRRPEGRKLEPSRG